MNALSPWTYTLRHKGRAAMLVALIALAVAGVYLLVGLFRESFVTPDYTINRYLSRFSLVAPGQGAALDPDVVTGIRAHPDVAEVLPQKHVEIAVPNVGGLGFYFRLLGLREADMGAVLDRSDVSLIRGELPRPGDNGVALSKNIARALGLEIGDTFDRSMDDNQFFPRYAAVISPLEVVGILSGDVRLGVMSYEYLDGHAGYRGRASAGVLIIARPGRQAAVETFLRQEVRSARVQVHTYTLIKESTASSQAKLNAIFVPVVLLVTLAVTLVVGALNQLAFIQRLPEFGTLHALGRSRSWLARRLTLETAAMAVAGWALGLLAAVAGMAALSAAVYTPQGFPLRLLQGTGLLLVAPIPLAVVAFTRFTASRALRRMDAVAVVERGMLSLERQRPDRAARTPTARVPRPLAVTTFYRRHARRAVTLVGAMALMIVGTALIVFIFDSVMDTGQPALNVLSRASRVVPQGQPLAPEDVTRIRAHPAVARAIPVTPLTPLTLVIPLIRDDAPLESYGVTAEAMAYLVDLYDLNLDEGHLPRPATNEIVIPWTAAQNRGLALGAVIGDPDHPIYPGAPSLPSELVVSGIFAPAPNPNKEVWLSFVSQEFIDAAPALWTTPRALIVVPRPGHKAALDAWLESEMAGEGRRVVTHRRWAASFTEAMRMGLFAISLMESIVALMAALALAGLNYVFVTQRRTELGVLNALGLDRWRLVGRVTRETLFTTGAAWLAGLLGCALVLAYLHYAQYAPRGLRLNFFNPTPWLFTLPVPVAVLVVSAAAAAWALTRLDPVAVIERR